MNKYKISYEHDGRGAIGEFDTEEAAMAKITELAINGFGCTLIYPDDYSDYGCPPPVYYPPLDVDKIVAAIGNKAFAECLDNEAIGYVWFENIQQGDKDTIEETIELYGMED